MYACIFRHLPGPLWVRIVLSWVLVLVVVWVLFELVFPAIAPFSPLTTEVTVPRP